jgi:hypothetical protein
MGRARLRVAVAGLAAAALGGPGALAAAPVRATSWAQADQAAIHPGVQVFVQGAQCTANFVFTDSAGNVYLGMAAHCAGTGAATETDGCDAGTLPEGTQVRIGDPQSPVATGTMAYSSWVRMQQAHETDANTCAYNDLALIRIASGDVAKVNPTVPFWGGPTGEVAPLSAGRVFSYGNSELRLGISQLSPKTGLGLTPGAGGWTQSVYTLTPGVPGDSGSAFLDARGRAVGVLSTLAILPLPGSNGVGSLEKEIAYARVHGVPGLAVVDGTEPFQSRLLPL